ncbi:uncharacterized protein [Physcomitrium patens]|uniref:uncharacterized protein isoform X2 n=1 Tax=Physcomitrium patens TaxID=3218 RepID=UPI003CCCF679
MEARGSIRVAVSLARRCQGPDIPKRMLISTSVSDSHRRRFHRSCILPALQPIFVLLIGVYVPRFPPIMRSAIVCLRRNCEIRILLRSCVILDWLQWSDIRVKEI